MREAIELKERSPVAAGPLSILLPARNVAQWIGQVLDEWNKVLEKREQPYEIIVIDDGSTDETPQLLEEKIAGNPRIKLIRHERARGFGAALASGVEVVQHPLVCYCPLDKQYEPAEIKRFLDQIDQMELVVGHRTGRRPPLYLRIAGIIYRLLARILIGLPLDPDPYWLGWAGWARRLAAYWFFSVGVSDPECAFRVIRADLLRRIPIQSEGGMVHVELLAKANFLNAVMTEVPLTYHGEANATSIALEKPTWREFRRLLSNPDFGPATLHVPELAAKAPSELPLGDGGTSNDLIPS